MLNINAFAIEKEIRVFLDNQSIRLEYHDDSDNKTAYFDGTTVHVPKPDPRWSEEQWTSWRYLIYHETCHAKFPDGIELMQKHELNPRENLGAFIVNAAIDYRDEYDGYDEYLGRQRIMSKGMRGMLDDGILEHISKPTTDKKLRVIQTLLCADLVHREGWQPDLIGTATESSKNFDEEQFQWMKKIAEGGYWTELEKHPSADEAFELVKRMMKEVFELDPEKEMPPPPEDGKGDGEGEPGDEKGESEGGKAEKGDGDGEEERAAASQEVDYDPFIRHDHFKEGHASTDLKINYEDDWKAKHYDPAVLKDLRVLDYTESKYQSRTKNTSSFQSVMDMQNSAPGMAGRVRSLLQIKSQAYNMHGQRAGKLSKKSMYRCTVPQAGKYSEKIFRKKLEANVLDTAVQVIVDFSGSMGVTKMNHAIAAASMLNEAIGKLRIPLEIYGFTDSWREGTATWDESDNGILLHYIFKRFDIPVGKEQISTSMINASGMFMGNNADGDSILWGYPRIAARKERRKIMIVLSDGSPATHRGDAYGYTKEIIKQIEKDPRVEIYGIGIMDENVTRLYKEHTVINQAEELEAALINVVKRKLIG